MSAQKLKPSPEFLAYYNALSASEKEFDRRVTAYEAQGMTRSDAQGVVMAEDMSKPL